MTASTDLRATIRDKVAEAVMSHGRTMRSSLREWAEGVTDAAIAAYLEALDEANRIESAADLDALPDGSIYASDGHQETPEVKWNGHWYAMTSDAFEPDFPGSVLWRPEGA